MLAPGTHVVCESTGHGHRALVAAAHAAGVALTVANPPQVRGFAKGLGRRAKTDPIAAQTRAAFGRVTLPKADPTPGAAQTALQELVVARQQAVLERRTVTLQAAGQQSPSASNWPALRRSISRRESAASFARSNIRWARHGGNVQASSGRRGRDAKWCLRPVPLSITPRRRLFSFGVGRFGCASLPLRPASPF